MYTISIDVVVIGNNLGWLNSIGSKIVRDYVLFLEYICCGVMAWLLWSNDIDMIDIIGWIGILYQARLKMTMIMWQVR